MATDLAMGSLQSAMRKTLADRFQHVKGLYLVIVCSALLSTMVKSQDLPIYRIVNKDGTVTYTDKPAPNAELVTLGPDNRISNTSTKTNKPHKVVKKNTTLAPIPKMVILSPSAEETIRDNTGKVTIRGEVSNPNKQGRFQLYVNEELVSEKAVPLFKLEKLDRGAYTFYIVHTNNTGKTLASSSPRTFYLHKASRLIN